MEHLERSETSYEAIKRRETVRKFIKYIVYEAAPELSYYCLSLNYSEIDEAGKNQLLDVILKDRTDRANEFAIRLLRDQPRLANTARDALLGHIVDLGDKTSCSLALTLIPNLGTWEDRLRDVLAK